MEWMNGNVGLELIGNTIHGIIYSVVGVWLIPRKGEWRRGSDPRTGRERLECMAMWIYGYMLGFL